MLSNITNVFSKNSVSIKRLIQNPYKSKKFSSIIIITHKSKNESLHKVMSKIQSKKYIIKEPKGKKDFINSSLKALVCEGLQKQT